MQWPNEQLGVAAFSETGSITVSIFGSRKFAAAQIDVRFLEAKPSVSFPTPSPRIPKYRQYNEIIIYSFHPT
jgi:hypothetical protein